MASLNEAFTKPAEMRVEKVRSAVEASEYTMNLMGWGNGFKKMLYKVLVPITPNSMSANDASTVIRAGTALKGWDLPNVPHTVLYEDEEKRVKKSSAVLSPATLLWTATATAVGGIMAMRAVQKHPELLADSWKTLQSVAV